LAAEGFDYHGVDGNAESIIRANGNLRKSGFSGDRAVVADFRRLPYPDDRFDAVIDRGSITCNHGADIAKIVAEVRRVLKPSGTIFSMLLHESVALAAGGRHIGNNDFVDFGGDLSGAELLHFTNAHEARRLFGALRIERVERSTTELENPQGGNSVTAAWTIVVACK
jgi:SAM-dependent methyltransferase